MLREELMVVIRKNTKPSKCIDVFEQLLIELEDEDPEFSDLVVKSMFKFITEEFELFEMIKRIPQRKFIARILDQKFIEPLRFFNSVKRLVNSRMEARAAIELLIEDKTKITVDTDKKPIEISKDRANYLLNKFLDSNNTWEEWHIVAMNTNFTKSTFGLRDTARKDMLVWNYIPAIIKAIIQNKRREYGIDANYKA